MPGLYPSIHIKSILTKMFSIVIPIFNEGKNITLLIKEIIYHLKNYNDYEIIIVNDSSTDNTISLLRELKEKNIIIINNEINKGQSYSIHKGIAKAKNNIIITIDGDGQNDPKDIPKLLDKYNSNEHIKLVGGIRTKRKDNLLKIISSKVANFIRSKILNDDCDDTGCSLKAFDKNIFLDFPYFNGIHRFLPALFKGYGFKTYFVNVNHRNRMYGKSKYGTLDRLFKGIFDIFKVKQILKNKRSL